MNSKISKTTKTTFYIVGVDPSTSSAGWCVLRLPEGTQAWEYVDSGQCRGSEVPGQVLATIPLTRRKVKILAIEGMFPGPARGKQVMPPTFWKMGFSAGYVAGNLHDEDGFFGAELWIPQPNEWRGIIGVKRGRRKAVARRMLIFARDITGVEMEGPRGGKQVDRAMAVGIAYAAAHRVVW